MIDRGYVRLFLFTVVLMFYSGGSTLLFEKLCILMQFDFKIASRCNYLNTILDKNIFWKKWI